MLGDCEGGALSLDDGRRFSPKRRWYTYNGAEVGHVVEPFEGRRLTIIMFWDPQLEPRGPHHGSCAEAVKAAPEVAHTTPEPVAPVKKSYRSVGKREKQEALFPELQKEIANKRAELYKGIRWPDAAARRL